MGNLADISRHTGLGVTTVSEILRNKPGYRDTTRQIVMDAASKLNYRPNLIARGLKAGQSKTIGVILGSLGTQASLHKIEDLEAAANSAGYTSFVSQSLHDRLTEVIDKLLARQIDGLILIQQYDPGQEVAAYIARLKIPVVYVGWSPPDARYILAFDRAQALEAAAAHMASQGHRQATFIRTPSDAAIASLKAEPWRNALQSNGMTLNLDPQYLLAPSRDYAQAVYQLIRARAQHGDLPGLLLMNNDESAIAAYAALADTGLRVPDDVSIMGYDDIPSAQFLRPGLSTIHQPRREVGVKAFELLLEAMANKRQVRSLQAKRLAAVHNGDPSLDTHVPTQQDTQYPINRHVMAFRFIARGSIGPAAGRSRHQDS